MSQFDFRRYVKKTYFAFALIVLASVSIDQSTKIKAEATLQKFDHPTDLKIYQGSSVPVYQSAQILERKPGFYFGFTYVRNQGAAWSSFNNLGPRWQTPFFFCVTMVAMVFVYFMMRSMPASRRLGRYALVLIFSGAMGNFLDRLRVGYVIDWVDVRWNIFGWYYDFPKFNVADSCISIGIALLLIDMLFLEKRQANAQTQKAYT